MDPSYGLRRNYTVKIGPLVARLSGNETLEHYKIGSFRSRSEKPPGFGQVKITERP
jgi:hypothetical protein